MSFKLLTKLTQNLSDKNPTEFTVTNIIEGLSTDDPTLTTNDLGVDYVTVKTWILNQADGQNFAVDLFRILQQSNPSTLRSDIRLVHIQCHKVHNGKGRLEPVKFTLVIDTINFTKCSQFTLANIEDIANTELSVTDVQILEPDTKAVLTVVIGVDNP